MLKFETGRDAKARCRFHIEGQTEGGEWLYCGGNEDGIEALAVAARLAKAGNMAGAVRVVDTKTGEIVT
jgi:hypothetical protein